MAEQKAGGNGELALIRVFDVVLQNRDQKIKCERMLAIYWGQVIKAQLTADPQELQGLGLCEPWDVGEPAEGSDMTLDSIDGLG